MPAGWRKGNGLDRCAQGVLAMQTSIPQTVCSRKWKVSAKYRWTCTLHKFPLLDEQSLEKPASLVKLYHWKALIQHHFHYGVILPLTISIAWDSDGMQYCNCHGLKQLRLFLWQTHMCWKSTIRIGLSISELSLQWPKSTRRFGEDVLGLLHPGHPNFVVSHEGICWSAGVF